MLIAGAGGLAKQLLGTLDKLGLLNDAVFYDDVSDEVNTYFFRNHRVIRSISEAGSYFKSTDSRFVLAVAGPANRKILYERLVAVGGSPHTILDKNIEISPFAVEINSGTVALSGVLIEAGAKIGIGVLINVRSIITHDNLIGDFTEIAPNATILGGVTIGSGCLIGASSTILPRLVIGKNVTIGAGALVTHDVPDFTTVTGVPAK
jgi:sugar O-acyltransferase (sialic acid O-acetyltransferase NeuD family)